MSREKHLQEQIDYHKQRQAESLEVYYDAGDRIMELEFQMKGLAAQALRKQVGGHLRLVSNTRLEDVQ